MTDRHGSGALQSAVMVKDLVDQGAQVASRTCRAGRTPPDDDKGNSSWRIPKRKPPWPLKILTEALAEKGPCGREVAPSSVRLANRPVGEVDAFGKS